MIIKLIKNWGDKLAGDIVGVSDSRAEYLKKIGIAEPDPVKEQPKKKTAKKTVKSKEV